MQAWVKRNSMKKAEGVYLAHSGRKNDLQILAWKSGRSVSGYIRHLIVQEIEANG